MPAPLTALKGIGPTTVAWLEAVGLGDEASLRAAGAVEAFRRLKAAFPNKVSWNALYALHAALAGVHWNVFPAEVKRQMREEVLARGPLPGLRP